MEGIISHPIQFFSSLTFYDWMVGLIPVFAFAFVALIYYFMTHEEQFENFTVFFGIMVVIGCIWVLF